MANICQCPPPIGGEIECDDDQLAMCYILGGKRHQICKTPQRGLRNTALVNWALSEITGAARASSQYISQAELDLLKQDQYMRYGIMTSFSLPPAIISAIEDMRDDGSFNRRASGSDVEITV